MKPYMLSEISILMDDQTQLLFPGKRAPQHLLSGKEDAVLSYSANLFRQFMKRIKKQRRKNMFSLIQS